MTTTVGIYTARDDAEGAVRRLQSMGFSTDRIHRLGPGLSAREIQSVPTEDAEQPGVGAAVGGVVGGAVGASAGLGLAAAAAAAAGAAVPVVGPAIAAGVISGALAGAGGAAAGGALEAALRNGLPRDEMPVYEEALRRGLTLVVAVADDERQAEGARQAFTETGAESVDLARAQWGVGLVDRSGSAGAA